MAKLEFMEDENDEQSIDKNDSESKLLIIEVESEDDNESFEKKTSFDVVSIIRSFDTTNEVLSQLGFCGFIVCLIQFFALNEIEKLKHNSDELTDSKTSGYLFGYVSTLFLQYFIGISLLRFSSAAVMNLSLLTSNFWTLLLSCLVDHSIFYIQYVIAFILIIVGVIVFHVPDIKIIISNYSRIIN